MNFIVRYTLDSRNSSMFIHVPLRIFYNGLQKGATNDEEGYSFYNKFLFGAVFFFVLMVFSFTKSNSLEYYISLLVVLCFTVTLLLVRYGFNHRDKIPISDDIGKFVSRPFFVKAASFILDSSTKSFFTRILCKGFYNSIRVGALMGEKDYYKMKSYFMWSIALTLLMAEIAFFEKPELLGFILVGSFSFGIFVFLAMLYGYTHREEIDITEFSVLFEKRLNFARSKLGVFISVLGVLGVLIASDLIN